MEEVINNLLHCAKQMVLGGAHEGPCDNENDPWGPCDIHLAVSDERRDALKAAIKAAEEFYEAQNSKPVSRVMFIESIGEVLPNSIRMQYPYPYLPPEAPGVVLRTKTAFSVRMPVLAEILEAFQARGPHRGIHFGENVEYIIMERT